MKQVWIVTDGDNECWHDTLESAEMTLETEEEANEELVLRIETREVTDELYEEVMNTEFDGFR